MKNMTIKKIFSSILAGKIHRRLVIRETTIEQKILPFKILCCNIFGGGGGCVFQRYKSYNVYLSAVNQICFLSLSKSARPF